MQHDAQSFLAAVRRAELQRRLASQFGSDISQPSFLHARHAESIGDELRNYYRDCVRMQPVQWLDRTQLCRWRLIVR